MPNAAPTELIEYDARWLDELVLMWRAAFEGGVGVIDPHPIEGQRDYFLSDVLPYNRVRLALRESRLVGFIAASETSVAQLHVRVGHQRDGIGTLLLEWAKAQSGGSLWLYTFARNRIARAFYERSGFVAVQFGFEPFWQLDDVKYVWSAAPSS